MLQENLSKDRLQPKIGVRRAAKEFDTASGRINALKDCSLEIYPNEIVSIVGPSGCGKTTLLWSMSGLLQLSSGEVFCDGNLIQRPDPSIGMVFQDATLLPWRTIETNILLPFEITRTSPDEAWISNLMQRVGLEGYEKSFPNQLSGGMQQRAALVRALAMKPSVLLMDEPFGALDAFTREEMNQLVEEIFLDRPVTIVLITHSIDEAIFMSDRVIVLSAGPGHVAEEFDVNLGRPRPLEIMATKEVFELTHKIKTVVIGERKHKTKNLHDAITTASVQ